MSDFDTRRLESSQHYQDGGKYTNPSDHPAERTPVEEGEMRGGCVWFVEGWCTHPVEFDEAMKVDGEYCSLCENYEGEGSDAL